MIGVQAAGMPGEGRTYFVPSREEPVPLSDRIEVKIPRNNSNYSPAGNFFQYFEGDKLT